MGVIEGAIESGPGPAAVRLAELFARNGYIRQPDLKRRKKEKGNYRKGWEVRIVVSSPEELDEARQLSELAGLRAGRPFKKHSRWVLPIYGKTAVEFFPGKHRVRK